MNIPRNIILPVCMVFLAACQPVPSISETWMNTEAATITQRPAIEATFTPRPSPTATPVPSRTPALPSYPEMTATALERLKTLRASIPPPQNTLSPEEALQKKGPRSISPNGVYGIACGPLPMAILYNVQTGAVIAVEKQMIFMDCDKNTNWSADSAYAFRIDPGGTYTRWSTTTGQIETRVVNVPVDINAPCDNLATPGPGMEYLAVYKGCGLYLVRLSDPASFERPLVVEKPRVGDIYEIRWVTPQLFYVLRTHSYIFYQAPTGKNMAYWVQGGGGGGFGQTPAISPDGRWLMYEKVFWGGGDWHPPTQTILADLEQGTQQIIAQTADDQVDFLGWKADSSGFYLISRPLNPNAKPDSNAPFGLLELNPKTGKTSLLHYGTWFAAFSPDMRRAYLAFPVRQPDGSTRIEAGLWETGTNRLSGGQVLAESLPEDYPPSPPGNGVMLSPTGEEVAFSARAYFAPLPGVWSHDGRRVATINAQRKLVVIDPSGSVLEIGPVATSLAESGWTFRGVITWATDDRSIAVGGKTYTVP